MRNPQQIIDNEIHTLESVIENPADRQEYLDDFFSNAHLLLQAMKTLRAEVRRRDGKPAA